MLKQNEGSQPKYSHPKIAHHLNLAPIVSEMGLKFEWNAIFVFIFVFVNFLYFGPYLELFKCISL